MRRSILSLAQADPTVPEDPVEVVRAFYDALRLADATEIERILGFDAVWRVHGRSGFSGEHCGPWLILSLLSGLARITGGTLRLEPREVMGGGDRLVALVGVTARLPSGARLDGEDLFLHRVRDGKIVEVDHYPNDQYALDEFLSAALSGDSGFVRIGR